MITRAEILKGEACPQEYEANLQDLLLALNKFRQIWGKPMLVTSGYRTSTHNQKIGGAKNSAHLYCQAADISDSGRDLTSFCLHNRGILEDCGLWMEHPSATRTWVHLQVRPAVNRIFMP